MSIAIKHQGPDPFSLPPAWWGHISLPIGDDARIRVRLMAETGDWESMVKLAALDVTGSDAKWFRTALKYKASCAENLLDYWMCAWGLCEMRSEEEIKTHIKKWMDVVSGRTLFDGNRIAMNKVGGVVNPVPYILDRLSQLSSDNSPGKLLVRGILEQALNGDIEAQYYAFESLARVRCMSMYSVYYSSGSKHLLDLMHGDEWRMSFFAQGLHQARRTGFVPKKKAINAKRQYDEQKDGDAEAEFRKRCATIESDLKKLMADLGTCCCVCHGNTVGQDELHKKKFTTAITLTDGRVCSHSLEVEVPWCKSCHAAFNLQQQQYDEDQTMRTTGKTQEANIKNRCERFFIVAVWMVIVVAVYVWFQWGLWPMVGCGVASVFLLMKVHDWVEDVAIRRIKKLYHNVQKPDKSFYLAYPPIQFLKRKDYQEGDKYVYHKTYF